jgi:hypothetical protein
MSQTFTQCMARGPSFIRLPVRIGPDATRRLHEWDNRIKLTEKVPGGKAVGTRLVNRLPHPAGRTGSRRASPRPWPGRPSRPAPERSAVLSLEVLP